MVLEEGGHGHRPHEQNIVTPAHYNDMDTDQIKNNSRGLSVLSTAKPEVMISEIKYVTREIIFNS